MTWSIVADSLFNTRNNQNVEERDNARDNSAEKCPLNTNRIWCGVPLGGKNIRSLGKLAGPGSQIPRFWGF
jgi:hypothetical protein